MLKMLTLAYVGIFVIILRPIHTRVTFLRERKGTRVSNTGERENPKGDRSGRYVSGPRQWGGISEKPAILDGMVKIYTTHICDNYTFSVTESRRAERSILRGAQPEIVTHGFLPGIIGVPCVWFDPFTVVVKYRRTADNAF